MGLSDIGEFLGHVGTLGTFKIVDNYARSRDADNDRATLDEQGKQTWQGDRDIIGGEWSRLRDGTAVAMAKEAVTAPEAFSTWSHRQIWQALNGSGGEPGVSAGEVNAGADGWRRLTDGTRTAVENYRSAMERVLAEKWSGASGNAAIEGIKGYAAEAANLPTAFQMVANGIDYMEGLLGQAKIAIPQPEEVSGFDEFVSHIPGNGVIKAAKHRATEAEADAQLFMIGTYQPGSATVDRQTPILPVPHNTVGDSGGAPGGTPAPGVDTGGNTPDTTGSPSSTDPQNTPTESPVSPQETPTDTGTTESDPTGTSEDTENTSPTSTDPTSTNPASTVPASTVPTSTTDRPTTSVDPRTGTPSPTTNTGAPTTTSSPDPGRSVPGSPTATGTATTPATRNAATTAAGRGANGMPGMMGAGRGANGGDDESEHKIPDYLVRDREHELIGQLPPTLPPGGVIGG
ncbi:PPE domain-containing protein [Nocardia asteroides]|uniref:PPE domain-containing protein n=1 Tax=Nocardia asteroides TaxID=1824 RepID=UPI001E285FDF|nr:hypothetical protein [Nocardia asteroides]UGT59979.1 hypothetical protein LTT61_22520 [Nocardia asteroides]